MMKNGTIIDPRHNKPQTESADHRIRQILDMIPMLCYVQGLSYLVLICLGFVKVPQK